MLAKFSKIHDGGSQPGQAGVTLEPGKNYDKIAKHFEVRIAESPGDDTTLRLVFPDQGSSFTNPAHLWQRRSSSRRQNQPNGNRTEADMMKQVTVVERPLAKQDLTQLRAKSAGHLELRRLLREIALLMGYGVAHSFETVPVEVQIHRDNSGKGFIGKSDGEVKNLTVTIPKRLKSWWEEDQQAPQ